MPTIVADDELLTTTAFNRLDHIRQMQFRVQRLAQNMLEKKDTVDGGERLVVPWDVQEHSVTTQHVTGYEAVDMTFSPVMNMGNDTWFFAIRPVAWSWVDRAKNSGKHKVMDLVEKRVTNTEKALLVQLEQQWLQANVAAMSDLNSLNGFDTSNGFFEELAVGSQTNTVHSVAKSTYSSLPGFQNQRFDMAGAYSTNGLIGARSVSWDVEELTDDPTDIALYSSRAGELNYLRTVQGQERYTSDERDGAKLGVQIAGRRSIRVPSMPNAGAVTGTSDQEWTHLWLDHAVVKFKGFNGLVMDMTPFAPVGGGQQVSAAFFRVAGQTAIHHFGTSGVAFGGDTY